MRTLTRLFVVIQLVLAIRVLSRMAKSASGSRIARSDETGSERVSVIVPVLNEEGRLRPCLEGLIAQGDEVAEILVVDGGSADGTRELVARFTERDARVRLLDAQPVPDGVNGKAHNLRVGYGASAPSATWLLTVDADVRPAEGLVPALLAQARAERVAVLSVATRQRLADPIDGALHPALLTTLVYRFGIPGRATADPHAVQANGQCMLAARAALERVGGFDRVQDSICEDVTLARALAVSGERVGFYEAGELIEVQMYASWRETWTNWTRSLPMRDRYTERSFWIGLAEVTLVQALPIWLALIGRRVLGPEHPLTRLNGALAATRLGVLFGTRRAYVDPPPSYWLSPLVDLPAAIRLMWMAARRRHTWRGRAIQRGGQA
ncbi:MAG: glycosyltransferase [Thermomicrobiales bacterium]|nr:glycosyltransferase [Thermomicrobiales bacterium]